MPRLEKKNVPDNSVIIKLIRQKSGLYLGDDEVLYFLSDNNQISETFGNVHPAKLAVFSGKLFRKILGEYQPEYYLCSEGGVLLRACNFLANYRRLLEDTFQIESEDPAIIYGDRKYSLDSVRNFTAMSLAAFFIGEADWDDTNIGLVPDKEGIGLVAVRIDPGFSFQFKQEIFASVNQLGKLIPDPFRLILAGIHDVCNIESRNATNATLRDGYLEYLLQQIPEDALSSDIKAEEMDYFEYLDTVKYIHPALASLFNRSNEVLETLQKITALTEQDLKNLALESGLIESDYEEIVKHLLFRKQCFKIVLENLILNKDRKRPRPFFNEPPAKYPRTNAEDPSDGDTNTP